MSFGYRTALIHFEFAHEVLRFVATVESCRSMFIAHVSSPFVGSTDLVQIPMICLQASKTGLVNADYSDLSEFGASVVGRTILGEYQRRAKGKNTDTSA